MPRPFEDPFIYIDESGLGRDVALVDEAEDEGSDLAVANHDLVALEGYDQYQASVIRSLQTPRGMHGYYTVDFSGLGQELHDFGSEHYRYLSEPAAGMLYENIRRAIEAALEAHPLVQDFAVSYMLDGKGGVFYDVMHHPLNSVQSQQRYQLTSQGLRPLR